MSNIVTGTNYLVSYTAVILASYFTYITVDDVLQLVEIVL